MSDVTRQLFQCILNRMLKNKSAFPFVQQNAIATSKACHFHIHFICVICLFICLFVNNFLYTILHQ